MPSPNASRVAPHRSDVSVRAVRAVRAPFLAVRAVSEPYPGRVRVVRAQTIIRTRARTDTTESPQNFDRKLAQIFAKFSPRKAAAESGLLTGRFCSAFFRENFRQFLSKKAIPGKRGLSVRAVRAVRAPFLAVRAVSGRPSGVADRVVGRRRKICANSLSDALAHRPKRGENSTENPVVNARRPVNHRP